jgi:opacity protein-like surface antigen
MNKIFFCVLLGIILSAGIWAQNAESVFSIGIGGSAGGDFGGGGMTITGIDDDGVPFERTFRMPYFGGSAFIFFDAKYLEVSLGFYMATVTMEGTKISDSDSRSESGKFGLNSISNGLLFKYPFSITDKFTLFPALGVTYQTVVELLADGSGAKYDRPESLSAIWFQFGGGLDYNITQNLYLRFKALYGLRTQSEFEKNYIVETNSLYETFLGYSDLKTNGMLGHGLSINLALGYKL